MTETQVIPIFQAIAPPADPAIEYQAALYFLDGHYLLRTREKAGWSSKFVTATDVQAAFTGKEQDSGWLPAGVVRAGASKQGKWFVYSAPVQKVTISFDGEGGTGVPETIKIPLPRTVLFGIGAEYYLWALKGERFDRNAVAHAAPFPNIHSQGKICWGASTPPRADPEKARQVWELFFSTPFNNHLIDHKSKAFPDDVRPQLRALAGKREYPVGDLAMTGTPIGTLIDHILKG
jgi:hypothetical protein